MDQVVGKPADDFQPKLDNSNDLGQVSSNDEDDMGKDLGDVLLEEDIRVDELDLMDQPDDHNGAEHQSLTPWSKSSSFRGCNNNNTL